MVLTRSGLIVGLCAIYSLIAALYPFDFSAATLNFDRDLPRALLSLLFVRVKELNVDDFSRNIFYFLPWGALVYVFRTPTSRKVSAVLAAVLIGGLVSLSIELSQILFQKKPSIFDILANSVGAGLGALLCAFSPIDIRRVAVRCFGRVDQARILLPAALFLGAVPLLITVSKFPEVELKRWNQHYTFHLGEMASLEAPWFGVLYLASVYDRALAPEAIAQIYELSLSKDFLGRTTTPGLVVFCRFMDGTATEVNDVSYCGSPPNFALLSVSNFRWLQGRNGIDILKPSVLRREPRADKLFEAIRGREELSVEVWLATAKVEQKERVISLALNTMPSDFRLPPESVSRTLAAQAVNSRSENELRAPEQFHLVVTYKGGFRELFVNGRKYPYKNFDLRLADFIVGFGSNPFAQIAYSWVFFFPVSFFFSRALSKRFPDCRLSLLVPAAIAVSLLSAAEMLQAHLFARSVDWVFVACGVVVVLAGAFCGIFLADAHSTVSR